MPQVAFCFRPVYSLPHSLEQEVVTLRGGMKIGRYLAMQSFRDDEV